MINNRDKISDVMAVLSVMKQVHQRSIHYKNIPELRTEAINIIAERELSANRYKDLNSAMKTIHDACARRLKPDIENINAFDKLVEAWLKQKSVAVKDILFNHSNSHIQKERIRKFFNEQHQ